MLSGLHSGPCTAAPGPAQGVPSPAPTHLLQSWLRGAGADSFLPAAAPCRSV